MELPADTPPPQQDENSADYAIRLAIHATRVECAEIARREARAISKGAYGRLESVAAIGNKIAEAILKRAETKHF